MATNFASGFSMAHTEPVDNRLVLSKAEMLSMKKAKMPQVYLTICSDDGNLYLYNSLNDINEQTGRFRLFSAGELTQESLSALVSPDEDNILQLGEDGTLKVEDTKSITEDQIKALFPEEVQSNGD